MANVAGNLVVAANGRVAVAPVGTALPTDATTALNVAFVELGYLTEDGVVMTPSLTVESVMAWQSLAPVRTLLTAYEIEIKMTLLEWKEQTLELAFGGGAFVDVAGVWTYDMPLPGERGQQAMVIEGIDGLKTYRIVYDAVELVDTGDIQFQKGDASQFPITLKALAGADGRPGAIYGDTV